MTNTTNYEDNVPCSAWAGVCARLSAQRFWPRLLPHRSGWDTIAITVLSQNYHHSLVFTNALNTWDFTPNYCWTKLSTSKWIIMARILTLLTKLLTSRGFGDRVHFLLWPRHSATQAQVNTRAAWSEYSGKLVKVLNWWSVKKTYFVQTIWLDRASSTFADNLAKKLYILIDLIATETSSQLIISEKISFVQTMWLGIVSGHSEAWRSLLVTGRPDCGPWEDGGWGYV